MGRQVQLALALALAACFPTAAQADLLVVDDQPGPGVDVVGIEAAVALATDGDTLLLKGGQYGSAYIDDKGLLLLADSGADVELRTVVIANLSSGSTVALQGVRILASPEAPALLARNSLGSIWFDDCVIRGGPLFHSGGLWSAAKISDCASVSFHGCGIHGVDAGAELNPGGKGLLISESSVFLFDTLVEGGSAGPPPSYGPGPGVMIVGGYLYVSGGAIRGGQGQAAESEDLTCADGGHGAEGIVSVSNYAQIVLVGAEVSGGAGGTSSDACQTGNEGLSTLLYTGELVETELAARSMSASSPVRGGEQITYSFSAPHGDYVYLAFSIGTGAIIYPSLDESVWPLAGGPLLMDMTRARSVPIGAVSSEGNLEVSFPTFPISLPSATLFTQLLTTGSDGLIHMGSGKVLTILGEGY